MTNLFKKINKKILSIAITFLALFGVWLAHQDYAKAATDYTSLVEVTDWKLINSSGKEASETNQVIHNSKWQLNVSWTLEPQGTTIQDGDTFSIDIPTNSVIGGWTLITSSYEDFKDSSGIVIGQWRISNDKIWVVFNDKAAGSSIISGSLSTGPATVTARYRTTVTQIQEVTMGNITKTIAFKGLDAMTPIPKDKKGYNLASNSQVRWYTMVNYNGLNELTTQPLGTSFTPKDTYFEDKLIDGGTLSSLVIQARLAYARDLTTGSGGQIAESNCIFTVTSKFKKIKQNAGESYADFKARLQPLQYGIYTDNDGGETIVVYFGRVGDNGLKYSTLDANFASNAAALTLDAGYYTEDDRQALTDYYNTTYGDNNIINGNVAAYVVYIYENYDKVAVNTSKTNTAVLTQDAIPKSFSSTAILQANMGSVTLSSTTAGLLLADGDTNNILSGADFKLQIFDGVTWSDYEGVGTLTTDTDGFIQTPTLGAGTYRFVQVTTTTDEYDLSSSQGYDSNVGSVVSEQFIIDPKADKGPIVNVTNVKYKYDITYNKGEHGTFADKDFSNVVINSKTPAFNDATTGETGYHFSGWAPAVAERVTADMTYIAQWEADVYEITYNLNGGTNDESNPANYTYGAGVDSFRDPTKEGYTFLGWQDEAGNAVTNISKTVTGAKTLVATWQVNSYNITYQLDGGTNDKANPNEYTYGSGVDSFKDPVKDGYKFLGWIDENGKPITNISAAARGDKVLSANWEVSAAYPPDKNSSKNVTKVTVAGTNTLLLAGLMSSLGLGLALLKRNCKL